MEQVRLGIDKQLEQRRQTEMAKSSLNENELNLNKVSQHF